MARKSRTNDGGNFASIRFSPGATAVSIACCNFFFGFTEPDSLPNSFRIAARFAGISMSLRRLFFPLLGGRSISRRSSFISPQSRRSTSARRSPVKAEIAKKGSHSRSRAAKIAKAKRDRDLASEIDPLGVGGGNQSSENPVGPQLSVNILVVNRLKHETNALWGVTLPSVRGRRR
jgi:hypothetical protein